VVAQYSGLDLLGGEDSKTVSFEYINGFILTKVVYGGLLTMNFIVDTGASHNILFKKNANDILGIRYTDTIDISGADITGELKAYVSRNVSLMLPKTPIIKRDIIILDEDYLELEKVLGVRVDGILGGDFFKGLVLELDFRKRRLIFRNPGRYKPPNSFKHYKIDMHNYKPYIDAPTKVEDSADTLKYLLDTGASLALLVHSNVVDGFEMPKNTIVGNLGKGLAGDLTGYIGLTRSFRFGGFEFKNVVTSFQDIDFDVIKGRNIVREGLIGTILLSRYDLIIDYVNQDLYLRPNSKLDKEFSFDKSGMLIYAFGENLDEYIVKAVYPDTPAEEAGVLPGDQIIKIGWWPIEFYELPDIVEKLQGKVGKKIKLKLKRGDEVRKVNFRLRNLFEDKPDENSTKWRRLSDLSRAMITIYSMATVGGWLFAAMMKSVLAGAGLNTHRT